MLTQEQLNHYQTFGFVILRNLFTPEEIETLQAEFDRAAERAAKFVPFDGTQRQSVYFNGQDGPFFVSLTEDPRFVDVAEQMYDDEVFATGPASCTRFINPGTKWHPDTINCNQSGVGFVFFLQPVRADHGALRVLPGSHRNPWHDELREIRIKQKLGGEHPIRKALGGIENVPSFACEADPCDVVAFEVRLWHASWGGFKDRRLCRVSFYNGPKTPEEMEATRWQLLGNQPENYTGSPWDDPALFPDGWRANPGGHPKRQRWIDQMRDIREATTGLRMEMTGMDGTLVPEAGQATYSRNQIEEALADLPVYGER